MDSLCEWIGESKMGQNGTKFDPKQNFEVDNQQFPNNDSEALSRFKPTFFRGKTLNNTVETRNGSDADQDLAGVPKGCEEAKLLDCGAPAPLLLPVFIVPKPGTRTRLVCDRYVKSLSSATENTQ